MNLIEAWNKAGKGQTIKRLSDAESSYRDGIKKDKSLANELHVECIYEKDLLADDWEILEETKKIVLQ